MPHQPASPALSRFRVVDLTQVRAGPTACRQLADWGADVIQVQMPEHMRGDDTLGRTGRLRLPVHPPQQALHHAQPEAERRHRDAQAPDRHGGCRGRELPPGREIPPRHRLRDAGGGQPAPGLCQHLRLRPDRPAGRAPRLRPDRAGHGRADVGDRASRRRPDARRHSHRGPVRGHLRGAGHPGRAAGARVLRPGPMGAHLPAGVHGLHDGLPDLALPDRRRSRHARPATSIPPASLPASTRRATAT